MKTRLFGLIWFVVSLATTPIGQVGDIARNEKYHFSIAAPRGAAVVENDRSVMNFSADPKVHGPLARFSVTSVRQVAMPLEEIVPYLKMQATSKLFERTMIGAMRSAFPDVRALHSDAIEFRKRTALEGMFTFTADKSPMRGRYLIVLVEEQRSLYTFTWSSEERFFAKWNKAIEDSVGSLKVANKLGPLDAE
jgi:hypothetical protein